MHAPEELMKILVCPKCRKGGLKLNQNQTGILCTSCKIEYEIIDDIPVMLVEEAHPAEAP